MISVERKRSERSQRPFVLLLIDTGRRHRATSKGACCWKCFPRAGSDPRNRRYRLVYDKLGGRRDVHGNRSGQQRSAQHHPFPDRQRVAGQLDTDQFGRMSFRSTYFPTTGIRRIPIAPATQRYIRISKSARNRTVWAGCTKRMIDVLGAWRCCSFVTGILGDCCRNQADFPGAGAFPSEAHRRARNSLLF